MDRASVRRSEERATRRAGVPVELCIGREIIDVWLDEQGIHFRQEGAHASEGVLPWGLAIAMSLLPPGLPRMPTATAV
jgi:hypothetical protein